MSGYYTQVTIAQDFELPNTAGEPRRLSEALQNGPVALVFYKASCPTCEYTFPFLQKIFADARRETPTIWAISQDDLPETLAFIQQHGLTFEVLIDEHPYPISTAYRVEFVPSIFLVGPDGAISFTDFGFTKASLNRIAGFDVFSPNDGIPAMRPG